MSDPARPISRRDAVKLAATVAALGVTIGVDPATLLAQTPGGGPRDAAQSKADQLKALDKMDQLKANQHKVDQLKANQYKMDQLKANQYKLDQLKANQHKLDQLKANQHKLDQLKANQHKLDQLKADQHKVDQLKTPK